MYTMFLLKMYFNVYIFLRFMWQICAFIPQSLEDTEELAELATKLTSAFFLETYIHAKERVCVVLCYIIIYFHIFIQLCIYFIYEFLVYYNAMDRIVNQTI